MTDTTQFNQGVQILLERIKSNPEEFHTRSLTVLPEPKGRWSDITQDIYTRILSPNRRPIPLPFLTDEEINALHVDLQPILAQQFTEQVMKELLPSDSSPQLDMFQTSNNGLVVTGTLGATGRVMGRVASQLTKGRP